MINLIKLQVRNLFKQKFYYICIILFLIMGPVLTFLGVLNTDGYSAVKIMPQIVSILTGELSLLSTIIIALFCCLDFNEGTTKNIIARGYSRIKLLFSKYIVSFIGLISMYFISFIVILILFGINGLGYEAGMGYNIINSIFCILSYTILFATMSFLLEKNGSAIIACLFAPSIISTILSLVDSKLNIEISKYWITNVSNEFALNGTLSNLIHSIIFYVAYIIIFVLIGTNLIKKREIK